jgi:hypothetical protein
MPLYNCESCNYKSTLKGNYVRHNKSKKHRRNIGEINELGEETAPMTTNDHKMTTNDHKMTTNDHNMSTKNHSYPCDFCELDFSTKPHKRRHELHFCKENVTIKDLKIRTLEKEKKKLEKQIIKMMDKVGTINNTTNNNTNNNTQNIIVVNNYGKENTDYLTVDKIKALLNRPFDSVQELIKMLHFNSDHPENHNVKITNKKEPYALVWNNPIWEIRKKKSVVKDIVDKGYLMIDTTHDNMDESNKKYINFQTQFDDDETNIKEVIEDETEIVIINETKKLDAC